MKLSIVVTVIAAVSMLATVSRVEAQTPVKVARVGILSAGGGNLRTAPSTQGFHKRMSELGWIEGQNLSLELANADGKLERLPGLATDLVRKVDVIVAVGNEFTLRAAKQATTAIPTVMYRDRKHIAQLALKHRVPTVSAYWEYAEAGGLMTYGADLPDMFGRVAEYVDRILRGAKPADLPIEQPTKFELVINLKTAKALGLTIPPSLLLRADQVIE